MGCPLDTWFRTATYKCNIRFHLKCSPELGKIEKTFCFWNSVSIASSKVEYPERTQYVYVDHADGFFW